MPEDPGQPVWSVIRKISDKIGEGVTTHMRSIARENPLLQGIIDRVVANPMWNQDWFIEADYDNDELDRFPSGAGFPGKSSADWGWVQHMHASLKPEGRAAVVLDTGAASRGSGNAGTNKEKTVRQWFVDHDVIESVLYLPENLFYNTTAPGIDLFLNRATPKARKGKILLVNASQVFEKGAPKNFIPDEGIQRIADTLINWTMVRNFDGGPALIEQWLKNKDTVLFLGVWEQLNNPVFKTLEFEGFKNEAGRNSFYLSGRKDFAAVRQEARKTRTAGEVAGEVTGEVIQLLKILAGPKTRTELQETLGLKGQANFRDRYLKPALDNGFIVMTNPKKPTSRLQKYRLTEKGRRLLEQAGAKKGRS